MERSNSTFLSNYEHMINILTLENKFSIPTEKDSSLEQNLLWRRRQSFYKNINSSSTSLESLTSNITNNDNSLNIENKYKYQFECPNSVSSMIYMDNKIDRNTNLNEKLLQIRKQFQ
ncbi:hypothetical protein H8356DRAFT_1732926 [Neocallimastix lanati (nom. inval.)]|jgi:hypothetical protein|uniref:Uncharacterized protein n=1 Tax=Neocallimastix californiae TaxID=1754190 RepID=A0A1Y2CVW1_9FUNG|nr:hypothetical protein H8356DRAFT_1732926 [Neocallimastix sp. JGI-2020a]ORY51161.1 hypothetical protein LY90DRAFT_702832 [Neocallimastix californiae]|eukprot:ORY51161.1 hypothetical protein LY90DRAFT_702832 [Neocallimastix californiae]